jgi:hypothetical protein
VNGLGGGVCGLESEVCMIGRVSEWVEGGVCGLESEVCMSCRVSVWIRRWVV